MALDKEVGVPPLISIKEHYLSKSTKCLTIQNSPDEDGFSYEAEARSSHHSATDYLSRSLATDRLTQSQKVTEPAKSTGQAIIPGHTDNTNVTSDTGHQATDSHQSPDNIQLPDINRHRAFTELQTGHRDIY